MKAIKVLTVALLLALVTNFSIVTIRANAASSQTGKVAGMVLDVNEARIVNAGITVTNGRSTYCTNSDEAGEFSLNVPPGDYRMKISADGFRSYSGAAFSLTVDDTRTFKVTLQIAAPQGLVPAAVR
jgi:hypothetical protein